MKNAIKMLAMILLGGILLPTMLESCSSKSPATERTSGGTTEKVTEPSVETTTDGNSPQDPPAHPLDGKKVIVIGNSYVFYGNAVLNMNSSITSQKLRTGDQGYFYQLCKANGAEVSVTNWCFGGHGLADMFGAPCQHSSCVGSGVRHYADLIEPYYDYVIVSPGGGTRQEATLMQDFDNLLAFFRAANPNVKVICLANLGAFGYSSYGRPLPGIYTAYDEIEAKGVTVADWGYLVKGIIDGTTSVPNATVTYSKNTFIVKDGYHPNPLAGYIASLVTYCTLTGEKAEGQPYAFFEDKSLSSDFNMSSYISKKYGNVDSNFMSVFASGADMTGIQSLVDKHLTEKPFLGLEEISSPVTSSAMLTSRPTGNILTNIFSATVQEGNGWMPSSQRWSQSSVTGFQYYSGLRGDKNLIGSLEGTTTPGALTEAQKADLADIGYGISVIGLSHMAQTAYDTTTKAGGAVKLTSLLNAVNGHYGTSHFADLWFDQKLYDINGSVVQSEGYTALITLNFGEVKTFEAIGYASSNTQGMPTAQDVFVSNDGITWTKVDSACYGTDTTRTGVAGGRDPWYNNKPASEVLYSMGDVQGKYIRIGILESNIKDSEGYTGISISEIMAYGK